MILALAQQIPASLRKVEETKTMFIPALINMLTEVEEDMAVWAETQEEKEANNTDPFNTAVNSINRISMDLGEKTILPISSQFIKVAVSSSDWK